MLDEDLSSSDQMADLHTSLKCVFLFLHVQEASLTWGMRQKMLLNSCVVRLPDTIVEGRQSTQEPLVGWGIVRVQVVAC